MYMCNYNVTFIAVHKHEHCNIVEHLTPSKYPELSHGLQWNLFTKVRRGEDTCGEMSYSQDQPEDGLSPVASLIKALRKWVILEPTIMLFLMSARMVYFTRLNLFLDVVCREMKNLTCDNLTQVQSHYSNTDRSQCSAPLPSPEPEGPCSPGGGGADLHGAQDREHRPHPALRPHR